MIRILTDTGSDIPYLKAKDLGVEVVELDIIFDEIEYDYRNDVEFDAFYEKLKISKNLPRTSQVNPTQYLEVFNDAKAKGDELLVLTISGGISGTYSSAKMAYEECGYDKITVVDTRNIITSQRSMVEHAVKLRDEGKSREEIETTMIEAGERMRLLACLDTLTYLKKGGRVPPAMALIGNAIKIKPVITLKDGKLEPVDKVRGFTAGKKAIWDKMESEGYDDSWPVYFGHTGDEERGKIFMEETVKKFGIKEYKLTPVGAVAGTHTGPNAVVVTYLKKNV